MKILAVEFSSDQRSVAVVEGDGTNVQLRGQAVENGGRNTRAFALIEDVLKQAGIEREEINCLAIGLGPGSYTGIRAAIALAQGWQLARGTRILGVSSAECLAAQAHASGVRGRVNVVIDAQRNEFYLAAYELERNGFYELEPLRIVSLAEIENRIALQQIVFGPVGSRTFAGGRELFADAATLGHVALSKADFVNGEELKPIYLRETSFAKAPPARAI